MRLTEGHLTRNPHKGVETRRPSIRAHPTLYGNYSMFFVWNDFGHFPKTNKNCTRGGYDSLMTVDFSRQGSIRARVAIFATSAKFAL